MEKNKVSAMELQRIITDEKTTLQPHEIAEKMAMVEIKELQELTSTYKTFSEGEILDMVVMEATTIADDKGESKPAYSFVDTSGVVQTNASVVFVGSIKKAIENGRSLPLPVRVVCGEKTKSKAGTYMSMKIYTA
jgi:hypothetical protein